MNRRQTLFRAAVLALVTLLSFDCLLIAQVGNTTVGSVRLSDRERLGLRGPVKTCSDFFGDDAEPMRDVEYAADGRLLVWRDNLLTGKVERVYSYDGTGKLISVTSSGADVTDEFHYDEQGKKTRVRTVPPRSPGRGAGLSGPFVFENAEEGDCLTGGGSVTTRYNDDDQPIESLVRDSHGELLGKIVHNFTDGRLVGETLVWVSLELVSELRELRAQELRVAEAQMKQVMSEMGLNNIERSYVYDDKGRVSGRLFRAGDIREETTTSYNEYGDVAGTVRIERCIRPHNPRLAHLDRLPLRDSLLLSIRQSRQLDRANNGRWAAILRDSPQAYILLSATGANQARFCPPQRRVNGRVIQILYNNLAVNLEGEPWGT